MITSKDRSGWFGASDTWAVMGNWETDTFARIWLEKLGAVRNTFTSPALQAGTLYEHRVLDALGVPIRDRQIRIRRLRLRVNLDGEDLEEITEVKTHGGPFRVTRRYWQQCQVEMYAAGKRCRIAAYHLLPEDYQNYFNPVDPARITLHPIQRDGEWLEREYLPRLEYLAWCLKKRRTPHANEIFLRRPVQGPSGGTPGPFGG